MSKRSGCGAAPRSTYVAAPTPQKGHSTSTAPLHHITYTAPRPRIWQSFVGSPRREGHVEVAPAIQHRCLTSEWEDARNIPSDWRLGSGHADASFCEQRRLIWLRLPRSNDYALSFQGQTNLFRDFSRQNRESSMQYSLPQTAPTAARC